MATALERFLAKVEKTDTCPVPGLPGGGCWIWKGGRRTKEGHGGFAISHDRVVMAYRYSYEVHRGPIPEGFVPDHLCRVPPCVNPWHLEPVTPRVNTLRGEGPPAVNAKKTTCLRGHALSGDNVRLFGRRRICRACNIAKQRRFHEDHPEKRPEYKRRYREKRSPSGV